MEAGEAVNTGMSNVESGEASGSDSKSGEAPDAGVDCCGAPVVDLQDESALRPDGISDIGVDCRGASVVDVDLGDDGAADT